MRQQRQSEHGSCTRVEVEEAALVQLIKQCQQPGSQWSTGFSLHYINLLILSPCTTASGKAVAATWSKKGKVRSKYFEGFLRSWPKLNIRKNDRMDHKRLQVTKEELGCLYNLLEQLHWCVTTI